ncbi:helix-turn-helix domain-containing protein [Hymenobacter sp. HSC-4F20]|uniref:helix-turn-helix domain-containing protein n=1 Tax=Hymenobacter sp. HSC-4F20 TaxID=2864135 RepID=UPI001C73B7FF|nr:helix-turn-helix transcriptional regulator [Hymenobacter sp. HSC-4F20]MBX0293199.1 helix-turn-helix domain-containing protein [Hymenobacter sp. HSC-4F20]
MELSEKLRLLRIRAKLSQSQVAERVGKDYSAIARYERGDVKPKVDVLQRIVGIFGMSLEQFYNYNPDEDVRTAPRRASAVPAELTTGAASPQTVTVLVELDGSPECLARWLVRLREFNDIIAAT